MWFAGVETWIGQAGRCRQRVRLGRSFRSTQRRIREEVVGALLHGIPTADCKCLSMQIIKFIRAKTTPEESRTLYYIPGTVTINL